MRHELERGEGLTCGGAHARARGMAQPGAGGGRESLGKGATISGVDDRAAHEHGWCSSD
jgi:hypothetical protein